MARRPRPHPLVACALALAAASVLAACQRQSPASTSAGTAASGAHASRAAIGRATVVRVIDGDTLVAHVGGRDERVRLIGIDTPESVKPRTPVQCYAIEASSRTKALLPRGTAVSLVRDVDLRDRYGRLLAYVYRSTDGLFVNLELAREGFARPYTFPPNVAHADEFAAAAGQARQAVRGLWARCESARAAPAPAAQGRAPPEPAGTNPGPLPSLG